MKKLFVIAIVSALLGMAFISTSCTQDFKGDLNQIDKRIDKLQPAVSALEDFQKLAQAQIDKNTAGLSSVQAKVNVLADNIKDLATSSNEAIEGLAAALSESVADITKCITEVQGRVAALELAAQKAQDALDELINDVSALYCRVRAISTVPMPVTEFKHLAIIGVDTTDIFEALFEISPVEAAKYLKAEDLSLIVREGVSKSALYEVFPVADCEIGADGQIAIKVLPDKPLATAPANKIYYSLAFNGADKSGKTYQVQSDYTASRPVDTVAVAYSLAYYGEKKTAEFASKDSVDYTALVPVQLFKGYEPMFSVGDNDLTFNELVEYLHLDPAPSLVFKDSAIVADPPFVCDTANFIFSFNTTGFTSKQLIGKKGFAIARVWIGGKYFGLDARKDICIWKHNQLLDPLSEPQIIPWSYVNSAAVNYTATKVEVPAVVYDSPAVTLGTTKIFKSADPAQTSVSGTVTVSNIATAEGKTTATVEITGVAPGKNEVDYNYIQNAYDDTLNLIAQIPFTVMPRPIDKENIVLADSTASYLTKGINVVIAPIQAALTAADTTEYFAGLAAGDPNRNLELLRKACALNGSVNVVSLKIDGNEIKTEDISKTISGIDLKYDEINKKDSTTIKFKAVTPGSVYDIAFELKAFGVTYSFTQKVTVSDVPFKLTTDPLFVKDDVVTVKGIINGSGNYLIEDINLLNYIRIAGAVPSTETGVKANFKLFNELGKTTKDTDKGIKNLPNSPGAKDVTGSTIAGPVNIQWKNSGDYTATKLIVKSWLTGSDSKLIGDTLVITIQTPVPVKDFSGGKISSDRTNGQDLEIKIWEDMFASSCLADTNIFNVKAASFAAAQAGNVNYGQSVETIKFEDIKATLNGSEYALDPNYFTLTNGVLKVKKECGKFTAPLVITIPMTLDYYLDYDHKQPLKSSVEVTINQK